MTPFTIYYKDQPCRCTLMVSDSERACRYWLFLETGPLTLLLGSCLAFELNGDDLTLPRNYPEAFQSFVVCLQKQLQWWHHQAEDQRSAKGFPMA